MKIDLTEYLNKTNIDIKFNSETGNSSLVISDKEGNKGTAYIINKQGKVVKEDKCGSTEWSIVPSSQDYLYIFERYCDLDFHSYLLNSNSILLEPPLTAF